jgi:hypothetical protein
VLADAGNGVITQSFLETYFPNWNFEANIPNTIPGVKEALVNGSIPGYTEAVAKFLPPHHVGALRDGVRRRVGWTDRLLQHHAQRQQSVGGAHMVERQLRVRPGDATAGAGDGHRAHDEQQLPVLHRHRLASHDVGIEQGVHRHDGRRADARRLGERDARQLATVEDSPGWTDVSCTNCGLLLPGDPRPSPLQPPFGQVGSDVVINCGSASGAFVE